MVTSTLSQKGQTTIPVEILRHLKVLPGDKLQYFVEPDGRVSLLPKTLSVKDLQGVLPKPARTVSVEEMDEAVRQMAGRNFTQSCGR